MHPSRYTVNLLLVLLVGVLSCSFVGSVPRRTEDESGLRFVEDPSGLGRVRRSAEEMKEKAEEMSGKGEEAKKGMESAPEAGKAAQEDGQKKAGEGAEAAKGMAEAGKDKMGSMAPPQGRRRRFVPS